MDHEKQHQEPEKIDSFYPLDQSGGFIFPAFPVHD
jgi:hypothetical protein